MNALYKNIMKGRLDTALYQVLLEQLSDELWRQIYGQLTPEIQRTSHPIFFQLLDQLDEQQALYK